MKDAHKYNLEYDKTVVLVRSGVFCNAFDDAALVLSAVTGYKVISQSNDHARCGFNLKCMQKVKQQLVKEHVSYVDLQTNPENEQAEILDSYDADTLGKERFVSLREQGRMITKAKQQAEQNIAVIRSQTTNTRSVSGADSVPGHPIQRQNISPKNREWDFIDHLCKGLHPGTGKPIQNLDLNDPDIIRSLFLVRDMLQ